MPALHARTAISQKTSDLPFVRKGVVAMAIGCPQTFEWHSNDVPHVRATRLYTPFSGSLTNPNRQRRVDRGSNSHFSLRDRDGAVVKGAPREPRVMGPAKSRSR